MKNTDSPRSFFQSIGSLGLCCVLAAGLATAACAQNEAPTPAPQAMAPGALAAKLGSGPLTEDALRQALAGKSFYLRGMYTDNTLSFDEHGQLAGNSPKGSFTLCLIEIGKVHLSKRHVELQGVRYGLHFLGALPDQDLNVNTNRVRITPKKKLVKIIIAREQVVKPKKHKKKGKDQVAEAGKADADVPVPDKTDDAPAGGATTTTSPEHAAGLVRSALDAIFSADLDEQMIAAMPQFWQRYFEAAAAHKSEAAAEADAMSQANVDRKVHLLTAIEPPSNEFAQNGGVAGMALYRAVIDTDGKAVAIAVMRPIGFGLDENAVAAIEKAKFEPALKDGKPIAKGVDVAVQFRIYSKRTEATAKPEQDEAGHKRKLPGPYTVLQP